MTIREKLADWISGGMISRLRKRSDEFREGYLERAEAADNLTWSIIAIRNSVKDQKSGTARRIARMCEEALK